ncbi:pentatricopeptide repeat-containing protein 2, mitochondrial [Nerophis lumbriciformis]|uniref:pentatricopeptide repeat-containing protein 2, mitochondrial n=1 Tax=Nerophis lumbriciformis TaxID=546530 RepID=UPI002AE05B51|nr:pentatricopeptide repeat-containing protein 2, mitochondrial-like [Nerophis lumbriciformis]
MALRTFALCCRSLLRDKPRIGLLSASSQPGCVESRSGARRYLLSDDIIGLQEFQRRKLAKAHLITQSDGNFLEQFARKLRGNGLILKDEMKMLLHLCHSAEDMAIARHAIYRYHAENRNPAEGYFHFGPLFFRLCYELGLDKMATDVLTDKEMRGFFMDPVSFNIVLDMLFTKGYHEDALEVLRSMKSQGVAFNDGTQILASGVCYKLNTAESHTICTSLMEEAQAKGHYIPQRAYCFAVALALKQNDIEKARLWFSQVMITENQLCQNLKVLLLAMSGATEYAITLLSAATHSKSPSLISKLEFSREVLDSLHLQTEDGKEKAKAEQVTSRLEQAGLVTRRTLDDMLCETLTTKRSTSPIMKERRFSRKTRNPLISILLSE